jgi:hypothetical protein
VGRRQTLGWLGAAVCSVALVITGGLVLSSFAVNRYLQASDSALQRGDVEDTGATPVPSEVAGVEHAVAALTSMPGVASASSSLDTAPPTDDPASSGEHVAPTPARAQKSVSYDVSVIMGSGATSEECADVVFAMTQQLQNARVNLELTAPAGTGHAASVTDYRNAFDTPVARSTVDSVSRAVAVAAAVPGVKSVRVMVPYTWNLASGDLDVEMATDDSHQTAALKSALARTALAGVDWSGSR